MKKKIIYFMMLAFSLSLFSACSDDDDNVVDYAKETQGSYDGSLIIQLGTTPTVTGKTVLLKRTGDNKTEVTLPDFQFSSNGEVLKLGDIVVGDIPVTKSGDTYTLTETKKSLSLAEGNIKADVVLSGTIKGIVLNLKIDVDAENVGKIPVTFSGEKKNK